MDIFTPAPGIIYKFTFEDGYSYFNGAYKVVKVMSFDEYLDDGGDIINDFYMPAFASRLNSEDEDVDMVEVNDTFLADQDHIRSHKILKLLPPEGSSADDTGIFVSMYYIKDTPDFNIKKYLKFGMTTYIGVTDEPAVLENMRDTIKMHVDGTVGVDSDPQFVSVGEEWLTDDEYQEIVNLRRSKVRETINYYTENVKLHQIIANYKDQIIAYEDVIKQLSKDVHDSAATISELREEITRLNELNHSLNIRVIELEEIING